MFLSLKIDFVLANNADPDEIPHYAAFHLGLHFLPKRTFRGLRSFSDYPVNPVACIQTVETQF